MRNLKMLQNRKSIEINDYEQNTIISWKKVSAYNYYSRVCVSMRSNSDRKMHSFFCKH